jgi:glycosyltransferase involved in cell wall biosynthesis
MAPLVSVIMPVFDGEAFLAEAIDSILSQSYRAFELIVVNDGSTDGSADIVEGFLSGSGKVRCVCQENAGVSAARNRGIEACSGDLIAFLDQDDRWYENALKTHVTFHEQHPEVGYTLAQQVCFLDGMTEPPGWFRLQKLDVPHPGYLPGTLVVKRSLFDQIGLFDIRYPISSDADWFARARDSKAPMSILPETLLQRRIHAGNQSRHSRKIQGELTQLLHASIQRKRETR